MRRLAPALLVVILLPATRAQPGCSYSNTIGLGGVLVRTSVPPPSPPLTAGHASLVAVVPEYRVSTNTDAWQGLGDASNLIPLSVGGPKLTLRMWDEGGTVFDGALTFDTATSAWRATVTPPRTSTFNMKAEWQVWIEPINICVDEYHPHEHVYGNAYGVDFEGVVVPVAHEWTVSLAAPPPPLPPSPPSPPAPPSAPPPPPSQPPAVEHLVLLSFRAAGAVEDYDQARRAALALAIAEGSGAPSATAANVSLSVTPGSVLINASLTVDDDVTAASSAAALGSALGSAAAAAASLNVTLEPGTIPYVGAALRYALHGRGQWGRLEGGRARDHFRTDDRARLNAPATLSVTLAAELPLRHPSHPPSPCPGMSRYHRRRHRRRRRLPTTPRSHHGAAPRRAPPQALPTAADSPKFGKPSGRARGFCRAAAWAIRHPKGVAAPPREARPPVARLGSPSASR